MKKLRWLISMSVCLLMMSSFETYARPIDILENTQECEEIYALEDEILEKVNYGSARGELKTNKLVDSIDFEKAYRIYSNSELFEADTYDKDSLMDVLNDGHYIWQIPVFIDGNTIIIDAVMVTEIPGDAPEDVQEALSEKLNKWTLGAMYVYNNRIVDYNENVRNSLLSVGLNPEDYSYAFVSGLPQIRYPVAVVFGEEAEFIIPAEEATTHAFKESTEELEYQAFDATASNATMSNANRRGNNIGFTVYNFDKVADAVESSMPGLGAGGIAGVQISTNYVMIKYMIAAILGLGVVVWGVRKFCHK